MRNVVAVKRVSKNRKENLPPEVSFKSHIKLFFLLFGVKLQKNKEGELTAVLLNVQLRILLETYLQNLF